MKNHGRKWISALTAGCLALSLAGCASGGSGTAPSSSAAPQSSQAGSAGSDAVPADVQKIVERGVLNVGVKVDVPKFGYKDPATNQIDGFEIDLARAVAKDILGDETKIKLEGVTAKTRGPLLDTGELDMDVCTFTITEERKKTYNFSEPYYTDGVALMVKKDAGYKSLADLDGKTIGVAQSATSKDALVAAAKEKGITLKFSEFSTYPEIKAALSSGRVDCFSVDGAILAGYVDDAVEILPDRYSPQEYGVATKLDNKGLAERIDKVLKGLKDSGELDKLLEKWGLGK